MKPRFDSAPAAALCGCVLLLSTAPLTAQDVVIRQSAPGETVRSMLSHRRSLAVTADGKLWTLVYVNDGKASAGDASRQLWLYSSANAGASWTRVTSPRTNGDTWGSLVVDPDGYTLHVAWNASNGAPNTARPGQYIMSVWHGSYDTRAAKWNGAKDTVLAQARSDREQFYDPGVEVTESGTVVVVFTNRYVTPSGWTGRAGSWNGYLTMNKGQGFSTPARINGDTFGVRPDAHAEGEIVHIAYRTNAGLYGTRYRSFDTRTRTFGAEMALPLPTGATQKIHSNQNCMALGPNGGVYVLYARNAPERNTTVGEIRVAYMKKGSGKFTVDTRLSDYVPGTGEKKIGGNNTFYHYTLATNDKGQVVALYGARNDTKKETYENLYMRILSPTGASPELPLRRNGRKNQFKWLVGFRNTSGRHGQLATYSDLSAIGPLTGGRAVLLNPSAGVAVVHGTGCKASLNAPVAFTVSTLPALSSLLGIDISRMPASAVGVIFLGANDRLLGAIPLPLSLAGLRMTGCWLYNDIPITLPFGADPQGRYRVGLPIPGDPRLKGVPLFWQALVYVRTAPGGAVVSNGLATIAR